MTDQIRDIAERAAWTFVQAFLGVFTVTDVSTVRGAIVAGVAAVLSIVKGLAKDRLGE